MAWTGLTAAALWSAAAAQRSRKAADREVRPGRHAVAVGLHTAWDSFNSDTAYVIVAALSLSFLIYATHRLATPRRAHARVTRRA
ncbi:hypothetical protein SCANM63S_06583 [Streptomyces canarius]